MNKNNLVVDREKRAIRMSRIFDAPRPLVWRVYTDPELVRSGGVEIPDHYCGEDGCARRRRLALHPARPDGNEFAFRGVYKRSRA